MSWRTAGKATVVLELVGLAAFSTASHFVPVALSFKALVIGPPFVLFACSFVCLFVGGKKRQAAPISIKAVFRYVAGTLTWAVLALVAVGAISNSVGNSTGCPAGITGTCYKTASWSIHDGHYYRPFPYDGQGDGIDGAPWVQITASEYTEGAGADFRQAIDFGICAAALNYLAILAMEASAAGYYPTGPVGAPFRAANSLPAQNSTPSSGP